MVRSRDHLPHSPEAEAGVLGGVLIRNDALALIDTLEVGDFYDHKNKVVFEAIRNLEASGMPIDIVMLENEIAKTGKLEAIGGVAYLGELTLRVPTVDNVEAYAKIVRDKRITREVMLMVGDVMAEAKDGEIEGEQMVHDMTVGLLSVATGGDRPIFTMAELVAEEAVRVRADVEAKLAGHAVFVGVPTGITVLDERCGGAPRGVLTMVIARPACGKTTVAMHLARSSKIANAETLVATYEDGKESFGQRGLGQESGLATESLRARQISSAELETVDAAVLSAQARSECLLPAAGMSAEQLVRRVRRENLVRRHRGKAPFGQLIVDYLQNMPQPDHARTRDEGLSHIITILSGFAQEEKIPVVMMCQLNREIEKRDDKRPRISDIRDCGAAEQAGKLILGLYRPWLYEPTKKDATGKLLYTPNDLRILVLKNNQGEAMGDISLWWDLKTHSIHNTEIDAGSVRVARSTRHEQQAIGGDEFAQRFDDAGDWHMGR